MRVLLGLGGNTGEVHRAFTRALGELGARPEVVLVVGASALYRSRAVGPEQPDFLNMVALVVVSGSLLGFLELCQELERGAGRDRGGEGRWGPRPLDLDLLLAEGAVHRGPRLTVPHPRFHERAFALVPAAELVPGWRHPLLGRTVGELAAEALARDPGAVERAVRPDHP